MNMFYQKCKHLSWPWPSMLVFYFTVELSFCLFYGFVTSKTKTNFSRNC